MGKKNYLYLLVYGPIGLMSSQNWLQYLLNQSVLHPTQCLEAHSRVLHVLPHGYIVCGVKGISCLHKVNCNLLVNLPMFILFYFSKSSNSMLGSIPHMWHVPPLGYIVCGVKDLDNDLFSWVCWVVGLSRWARALTKKKVT